MKIWFTLFVTVFPIIQVRSKTILLDSNEDCRAKDLVRRQIIRPFPPGTALFVDGKCVCGGQNEILYEYVPGDEPIADNSNPAIMEPQPNNSAIGNYGSPEFSSDVQTLNLFNVKYKSVCCSRVRSSPSNNTLLNDRTGNELPDKVSEFDLTKENVTARVKDERNTTYANIENGGDKCALNKTSRMELNGLAVCITTSEIESDSLKNISPTTKTSEQRIMETSMADTQNNCLSTVIEVKKHLNSRKENVNNKNHVEKLDKQLPSKTKTDTNHAQKCVFVQTTKQQHSKQRHAATFKKHNVLSYNSNGRLLLIITRF